MKKRSLLLEIILALGLIASLQARADEWSGAVTLTSVQAQDTNGALLLFMKTSQSVLNPAGCASSDGYVVADPVVIEQLLAIALSALASGTQVNLFITTTSSNYCANGRPTLTAIAML